MQTATQALSISITAVGSTQYTIWPSSAVPSIPDAGADSSVEVGVAFRSDNNGYITGIRFYKGTGNVGTHIANLWSSAGALLASATFTNETASGWQQVTFSSPVAITASTTYVASYHTSTGHYSDDQHFFATDVNSAPLHAPAAGWGAATEYSLTARAPPSPTRAGTPPTTGSTSSLFPAVSGYGDPWTLASAILTEA